MCLFILYILVNILMCVVKRNIKKFVWYKLVVWYLNIVYLICYVSIGY